MGPLHITAGALVVGILLTAVPSFADRDGRQHGNGHGRHERAERAGSAQPRSGGESRGRVGPQTRSESRGRVESQGRVESFAGSARDTHRGRTNDGRSYDRRSYGDRTYDHRSSGNHRYNYQPYGSNGYRSYGYRSYSRSYAIPYGYHPRGYRPGWSLNLYFGRPYAAYGYPGYGYPSAAYGYYSLAPGRAYGAIRIVDAPRDAQVFVDGYYAGVVDEYDGVFQHLNLEAGAHRIEIEVPGYPPIAFDVRVEPGQTMTYHANMLR
jgi:hypothetical protein